MVDRLHQCGRNNRAQAGINDSRLRVRTYSTASTQACRRASSSPEFGQSYAALNLPFRAFIERHFVPNVFPTLKLSTKGVIAAHSTLTFYLLLAIRGFAISEPSIFQHFVLQKMEGGLTWATCDHLRNLMSKIFTTAKKWNFFLGQNPAVGVELPEKNVVREKHVLTPSQILQLLALLKEPCRTMVLLGLLTGLRVGEILGLRWKDIDLISGQLRVEQTIYRGMTSSPKTQGSRRTLPLPQPILQTLLTLYEQRLGKSDLDLVFSTSKGTPLSDTNLLHRELKPAGRKIGTPWLGWHTLRRTHATCYKWQGVRSRMLKPSWDTRNYPPRSKSTPCRFPPISGRRSKTWRVW